MKHKLRLAAVFAAAAIALTGTALAAAPTLREALSALLGSFEPYVQTIEGVTAVDQGIEVRAVSALSDGNAIRIYLEVKDLTGDRLDEFTASNLTIEWPEEAPWSCGVIDTAKRLGYDPETKTLLYSTGFVGDGPSAKDLTVTVYANVISPGRHEMSVPFPQVELGAETLKSRTLDSGQVVLEPGQTRLDIPGTDLFSLSSYGFAADGKLHQLFRLNVETTKVYFNTFLSSKRWEAGEPGSAGLSQKYNQGEAITFREDGYLYYDIRCGAEPEDASDISPHDIMVMVSTGEPIRGEWRLEIPLADAPIREVDMGTGTVLAGVTAKKLYLTTIGATLESDPGGTNSTLGYPMALYLADGTVFPVGDRDGGYCNTVYATNHWSFEEPLDIEQVTGVAIGLWYVPIEGDAAGEGHWLPALPE